MTGVPKLVAAERVLTPDECAQVAAEAAASVDPADYVVESDHQRIYELLWRNDGSEAWFVSWWGPRDTGYHDHDGSNGGIHVLEGRVTEEPLVIGRPALVNEYGAGDRLSFDGSHIHRMHHDPEAVTIHVYSPPISRLGVYDVVDGIVRRTPQSPDEATPETPSVNAAAH